MFDLKKFENNIALVTESNQISYSELDEISKKIGNAVGERCLIFLFAKNSVAAVGGYLGFVNKKIVPMMIDAELNLELAKNLIEIYRPQFFVMTELHL